MGKMKYYVVDVLERKTLAIFRSMSLAHAYCVQNDLVGDPRYQIWGYDPSESKPRVDTVDVL